MWVILIAVLLGMVYLLLCRPTGTAKDYSGYYAHRGLFTQDQLIPENSLAAFQAAVDNGYGIELDVQLSKDGIVYVFHDDDLKRMCGIDKAIEDLTSDEISAIDLMGSHIPSFASVLELVRGQVTLIVELKSTQHNKALCETAYSMLEKYGGKYCIESFDPRILLWFKANAPQVIRGQLLQPRKLYKPVFLGIIINSALMNACTRPHFIALKNEQTYYPLFVRIFRKMGGILALWTVHEEDKLNKDGTAIIFEFYHPQRKPNTGH